jgi:hypothetical protein
MSVEDDLEIRRSSVCPEVCVGKLTCCCRSKVAKRSRNDET